MIIKVLLASINLLSVLIRDRFLFMNNRMHVTNVGHVVCAHYLGIFFHFCAYKS